MEPEVMWQRVGSPGMNTVDLTLLHSTPKSPLAPPRSGGQSVLPLPVGSLRLAPASSTSSVMPTGPLGLARPASTGHT